MDLKMAKENIRNIEDVKKEIEGVDLRDSIVIRCAKCGQFDNSEGKTLLIDFKEQEIHCFCRNCRKENSISLKKPTAGPLPKIRGL